MNAYEIASVLDTLKEVSTIYNKNSYKVMTIEEAFDDVENSIVLNNGHLLPLEDFVNYIDGEIKELYKRVEEVEKTETDKDKIAEAIAAMIGGN